MTSISTERPRCRSSAGSTVRPRPCGGTPSRIIGLTKAKSLFQIVDLAGGGYGFKAQPQKPSTGISLDGLAGSLANRPTSRREHPQGRPDGFICPCTCNGCRQMTKTEKIVVAAGIALVLVWIALWVRWWLAGGVG